MTLDEQIKFIETELEVIEMARKHVPLAEKDWSKELKGFNAVLESLHRLKNLEK